MAEQNLRRLEAFALAFPDGASELIRLPVDDVRCEQIEPGDPEMLGLGCPVADFSLTSEPQCALQVFRA